MSRVVMFDAVAGHRALQPELLAAFERVFARGRFILGPEVERFERDLMASLGGDAPGLAPGVAVGSGTEALEVALRALGVGPDDEVVTVPNTAVATVSAIRQAGARPVFCDVDPVTGLMDLERLPACLSERTRVVLPVHLYGNAVDVPRLVALVAERGIRVLEDCAQAHGARLHGRPVGTLGDAAAFSFYPTKNLGACGDAGLCASADAALRAAMRSIRTYGAERAYGSEREGINSRMDELQAAVLNVKLAHVPAWVARRRALAARYDRALDAQIARVPAAPGVEHAYHLYVVRVPDRAAVRARLAEAGVDTGVHYPVPIHRMRAYAFLGHAPGSLPAAERWAEEVLSLPLYPELPEASVDRVAEALNRAVAVRSAAAR